MLCKFNNRIKYHLYNQTTMINQVKIHKVKINHKVNNHKMKNSQIRNYLKVNKQTVLNHLKRTNNKITFKMINIYL